MKRCYYVYILTNKNHTVLYTGVTGDLIERVQQHRSGENQGFTARYQVNQLVYYEEFQYVNEAIVREKKIKAGSRKDKETLVNSLNPE